MHHTTPIDHRMTRTVNHKRISKDKARAKKAVGLCHKYEVRMKNPLPTSSLAREYYSKLLPRGVDSRRVLRETRVRVMISEGELRNARRTIWGNTLYMEHLRQQGRIPQVFPTSPSYNGPVKQEDEEENHFVFPEYKDYVGDAGFRQVHGPGEFSPGYDPSRCMYAKAWTDKMVVMRMPKSPAACRAEDAAASPPHLSLAEF